MKKKKEIKKKRGRPLKISENEKKLIVNLFRFGLTDAQLSEAFGVSESTLNLHKKRDPEFSESLKRSKEIADEMVIQSLFKRALGYEYQEEFATKDGAVDCRRVSHPDVLACIFWLKNRRPKEWKDKHELDPGAGFSDLANSLAGIFRKRYEKEAPRLAAGEDPSLVLFGQPKKLNRIGGKLIIPEN